jgi:hypothetical protein
VIRRFRHGFLALYAVSAVAALTWPGFVLIGNRVEPYVMGLPFVFFWNVLWVGLSFLVLVVYHATGRER